MDYINLAWLDPITSKMLPQSIWPYTEDGVATPVWNCVLYCLPVFKTAVVMCSFNSSNACGYLSCLLSLHVNTFHGMFVVC